MIPENIQERKKAFGRFILFFTLTILTLGTAVFFGIRLPYVENNKLREQLAIVDSENVFRDNFLSQMLQAQSLLDTINKVPASSGLLEGRITQNIQSLDAMINTSNNSSKTIYVQIVKALNLSQSDKAALRAAGNKDSVVSMYNSKIGELNTALTKWQDAYKQLEMENMMLKQSRR